MGSASLHPPYKNCNRTGRKIAQIIEPSHLKNSNPGNSAEQKFFPEYAKNRFALFLHSFIREIQRSENFFRREYAKNRFALFLHSFIREIQRSENFFRREYAKNRFALFLHSFIREIQRSENFSGVCKKPLRSIFALLYPGNSAERKFFPERVCKKPLRSIFALLYPGNSAERKFFRRMQKTASLYFCTPLSGKISRAKIFPERVCKKPLRSIFALLYPGNSAEQKFFPACAKNRFALFLHSFIRENQQSENFSGVCKKPLRSIFALLLVPKSFRDDKSLFQGFYNGNEFTYRRGKQNARIND
ncbi:Uncharacterized protein dnm_093780 [Desulfonema magnum]|uniref:Uncharacterized protein n=1 Tax=Desulfonema magnum TaxID=45655 RepID=A0A975BXQ2_9BACT|nr:Uncharacterized protein dnm_093780 [Desulfonema magnum]